MKPSMLLSRIRRSFWLIVIPLFILGWWLSGPDEPTATQHYIERPYRISPDGQILLLRDGQIVRRADGQVLRIVNLSQAAFSANGSILAVRPSEDRRDMLRKGQINLFRTSDQSPPIVIQVENPGFGSLAINNSGTLLAVGGESNMTGSVVTIYDTLSNRVVVTLLSDEPYLSQLSFTPDDHYLFAFGGTSTRIIDTTTWQMVYRNISEIGEPAFSATQRLLATHRGDSFALMRPLDQSSALSRSIPSPYQTIDVFTFNPDGQYLAVIQSSGSGSVPLVGQGSSAYAVRMALVRVVDGAVVQRFEGPSGAMSNPTFTPDGQQIMTIGPGDGITFWQVAPRAPWNVGLRLLPALLGLLLLLEQVRRFIVCGMRRPT
jgi:WD40 repeat protein